MTDQSPEAVAGNLLRQLGWKLVVAESCTGGLVGHRLTNIPGSSDYFIGGVIAYANEAKTQLLDVKKDTLDKFGAVSRETVIEMAHGVRKVFAADIAMAVSGIAGPGGGTPEKPVGLTWVGLSTAEAENSWEYRWDGDRVSIKELSAQAVLERLVAYLKSVVARERRE